MKITYTSQYQDIIVEKTDDDLRLTVAGDLQFSSQEEYLYNEAMVDYPLSVLKNRSEIHVLILGGGDGLLANQLIRYQNIDTITLCELDPEVVKVCSEDENIREYNENIFQNPKLSVIYHDAFEFVKQVNKEYDLIIADFPNPHIAVLSKLYSVEFYENIEKILKQDGIFISQVTEVHHTKKCFQCVWKTLKEVFPETRGFSRYMEYTMGHLGFLMGAKEWGILMPISVEKEVPFEGEDMPINTLENMKSFHFFDEETEQSGFIPGVTNRKHV